MGLPDLVALDTNCFVYAFEQPDSRRGRYVIEHLLTPPEVRLIAASLVVAELLAQPYALGLPERASRLRRALETLPGLVVIPLTLPLADRAAELRARLHIPLPDAVVLATAADAGAPLLTNDTRLAAAESSVLLLDDLVESR